MSLIKCPKCSSKISYEYDICPECGGEVYDFEDSGESEDKYDGHYADYVSTTKKTRWYFKFLIFISMVLLIAGAAWGIDIVFISKVARDAPDNAYYLVIAGAILYILTKIFIRLDKRKENF